MTRILTPNIPIRSSQLQAQNGAPPPAAAPPRQQPRPPPGMGYGPPPMPGPSYYPMMPGDPARSAGMITPGGPQLQMQMGYLIPPGMAQQFVPPQMYQQGMPPQLAMRPPGMPLPGGMYNGQGFAVGMPPQQMPQAPGGPYGGRGPPPQQLGAPQPPYPQQPAAPYSNAEQEGALLGGAPAFLSQQSFQQNGLQQNRHQMNGLQQPPQRTPPLPQGMGAPGGQSAAPLIRGPSRGHSSGSPSQGSPQPLYHLPPGAAMQVTQQEPCRLHAYCARLDIHGRRVSDLHSVLPLFKCRYHALPMCSRHHTPHHQATAYYFKDLKDL